MNTISRRFLTPIARAYIRYAPFATGKTRLWERLVEPYLAWQPFAFMAPTRFGSRIAGDTRDIIQQYVYYFGQWEPNLTHWMRERLKLGDTFVDVGANIGYFSLLASRLVGDAGSVVAIEASPRNFAALQANLERNAVRNVRAVNVAAAECESIVKLYGGDPYNSGGTSLFEDPELTFECEIRAASLPSLLRPEEICGARLIKIDVEGAEWGVIVGMEALLADSRDDLEIIVEVSPKHLALLNKTPEDLMRRFTSAGFHPYVLENDYEAQSYLRPALIKRPYRMQTMIDWETDIVFSRRDAATL